METDLRDLIRRLDDHVSHLSDHVDQLSTQVEELRDSVRQAVVVARADPEMALTKARKILERVLHKVWEHYIPKEPIGTRPLDEVLQRLTKAGFLPRKQAAYAIGVKELGNVGTHVHDAGVDQSDVAQSLGQLIPVLEWFFDQDWANGMVRSGLLGEDAKPARGNDTTAAPSPEAPQTRRTAGPAHRLYRKRHLAPIALAVAGLLAIGVIALIARSWLGLAPAAREAEGKASSNIQTQFKVGTPEPEKSAMPGRKGASTPSVPKSAMPGRKDAGPPSGSALPKR
jgi:Domain of unknown function (DUF4145)